MSVAVIVIFGGSGYVGTAIGTEALRRGHEVIAVARSDGAEVPAGATLRRGSIHDRALVDELAHAADVLVVSVPGRESDERSLVDAVPALAAAGAQNHTRLGVVGGAGSLRVADNGPLVIEQPDFPEAALAEATGMGHVLAALQADTSGVDWFFVSPPLVFGAWAPGEATGAYRTGKDVLLTAEDGTSEISGADFALAFVDEIDAPKHRNERFTVAH